MKPMLNIAVSAARAAGKIIMRYVNRIDSLSIKTKMRNDFVTEVDNLSEQEIIRIIRRAHPQHAILAEESGIRRGENEEYLWIIDRASDPELNIHEVEAFFKSMLLRVDWSRDLHFQTRTTIDTLDYSGSGFNQGSKLVIAARGASSAASAASAAIDHMHDWVLGTPGDDWVSMGIPSDGSYGIETGIIYSYPVRCKDGEYEIVQDLEIPAFSRERMDATEVELREERSAIEELL